MISCSRLLYGSFLLVLLSAESATAMGAEGCEEVFVGAGWSGVYSFYRRIMDDPSRGSKACLFEESWRVGGRTYSVHTNHTDEGKDFVQDVGAYRFSPDMHLPGDLILYDLSLATQCYAQDCPNPSLGHGRFDYEAPLRRIIDPETKLPLGYVTPLRKMIEIAKGLGGRVFVETPLVKLTLAEDSDTFSLEFEDRAKDTPIVVRSPSVLVLNLPRHKLFEIQGVEDSLETETLRALKCIVNDFENEFGLEPGFVTALEKAYLYYSDAWWRTVLNKPEGYWPSEGFGAYPSPADKGLLFSIRFHDGPVSCDDSGKCDGLLQIYYSISNETVYSSTIAEHPNDPLGSVWDTDGPEAVAKLNHIHLGLMDFVQPLFAEMGIDDPHSSVDPPLGLIVGVWNYPNADFPLGSGYTAPTKLLYDLAQSGLPEKACGVPGLTDVKYRDSALQPWGTKFRGASVFLANNDWICNSIQDYQGDWAEESLLQAERAMYLLGTPKPRWLDENYYKEKIESKVDGKFGSAAPTDHGPWILAKKQGNGELYAVITVAIGAALVISQYRRKLVFKRNEYTPIS